MKTFKILITALVAFATAQAAMAVKIQGDINFAGSGTLDGTPATATSITFSGASVFAATGDYAGLVGETATFTDFAFGVVGTTGPLAVTPLWAVLDGITYEFSLTHLTLNALVGSQRNLEGYGIASVSDGSLEDTAGIWTLSTSGQSTTITFSSFTSTVPDAGATSILLGLGLIGLVAARRFKK